jgi:LysM repeat protein
VQSGDDCHLIALNFTISVGLFQAVNPDVDSGCTNLVPGLSYCVFPTRDWNETTTGTTSPVLTAPAPTPTGTTENCLQVSRATYLRLDVLLANFSQWYVVKSGDYCAKIESAYAITMAQLQLWNPDLKDDCSNLQIDDAYCVQGGSAVASTSTPSGTTAKCFQASNHRKNKSQRRFTNVPESGTPSDLAIIVARSNRLTGSLWRNFKDGIRV